MLLVLMLCGTATATQAEETEVKYVLSSSTYLSSPSDAEWLFRNGFSITNGKEKTYGAGKEDGFKLSAGVQYTITLPDNFTARSITLKGYDNYGDADSYIKEVNGTNYGETDYVFPKKNEDESINVASHSIDFATPTRSSLTLTIDGKQVVCSITLTGTIDTGDTSGTLKSYTINTATYKESNPDNAAEWIFKDGISVTNLGEKSYSNGMNNGVKYSANVQFTISLPEKFKATSFYVSGYGNNDEKDTYLGELNGKTFGETDYVFAHRESSKKASMTSYEIDFDAPATGQVTFTAMNAQAVFVIIVNGILESEEGGDDKPTGTEATYTLTTNTYEESNPDNQAEWKFKDGFTITNPKDKAYGAGKEDGFKASANVVHTIKLPSNFSVQSVTFKGYDNYAETDAYLKEVNGNSYGETDYVFPMKDADGNYTVVSHTFNFDTPVTDELTFTPAGKQIVVAITLKGLVTTNPDDQPAGTEATYDIAISTYEESNPDNAAEWKFKDGITVTNEKEKAYSTGKDDGVKYSAGVQFTVNLPKNFSVQEATFKGYDNYDDADSYIKEVNGTTYEETEYVFPKKDADGKYTVVSHKISFPTPVANKLTFTAAGKQVVLTIKLKGIINEESEQGIPGDANEDGKVDVTDVMTIVNYVLNVENPKFNFTNADISKDGSVNVTDAMMVVDVILNKDTTPQD